MDFSEMISFRRKEPHNRKSYLSNSPYLYSSLGTSQADKQTKNQKATVYDGARGEAEYHRSQREKERAKTLERVAAKIERSKNED